MMKLAAMQSGIIWMRMIRINYLRSRFVNFKLFWKKLKSYITNLSLRCYLRAIEI